MFGTAIEEVRPACTTPHSHTRPASTSTMQRRRPTSGAGSSSPSSCAPRSWTCSTRRSSRSRRPTVRADLGGSTATMQWWAAGYTLAFGIFLIIGGRLGDAYGRRRLFLIGITGFTIASVLCALAPSPDGPDRHARAAGRVRGRAHPAGPRHHQDGLPAEGDGRRVRGVRPGDGPRRDLRADPRRLARRRRPARHRLEDDLPDQRAGRRARACSARCASCPSRSRPGGSSSTSSA